MQAKLLFLFSAILSLANFSHAQTVIMGNGSTTACSGIFYDSGGNGGGTSGNYASGLNITYTVCPSTPGSQLQMNFTSFFLEDSYDFLAIYNGNSTAAPTLGTYTGVNGPGFVQANNPTGCLTFVFTSDGSVTELGWIAAISCSSPCQTIIPSVTSNPALTSGTFVDVCQGDVVTFTGSGAYPQNGNSYTQSNATSTFNWTFSDGGTGVGQVVNHTYNTPGIYQVELVITDVNGCSSTLDVGILIRVSDDPVFDGSFVTNPVICLGETNTLTGAVTPTQIGLDCTPPVAGTTFLPDGSGVSYSTAITVDCFSIGQTVTSGLNIDEICVTMEHSFLGDLEIEIECPNGQTAILKAFPGGGGTYLGFPFDPGPGGPGTGWEYCFDMSATTLMVSGPLTPSGNPAGSAITAGSYLPVDNFNNLIGCPLNGDWTINVTDNLASDDGYIFGWSLGFNSALLPSSTTYTPAVVSESWQADPTIVSTAGNTITVQPTAAGTSCYTYEMVDEFDCVYDTTICFTVLPPSDPSCPSCYFTSLNVSVGACEANNTFTVTGNFTFEDNPGSGNLIVEVTNSAGTYTQTFTPGFVDGQVYNFSVAGIPSNGSALTVTVYFANDVACTIDINSVSPISCACNVDIGTFSVTTTGTQAGNNFVLCFGDDLDITSNGDGTNPGEAIAPPGPPYTPGISWLVYSCPPSVALVPDPVDLVTDDPCLLGIVSNYDLFETNDMYWITAFPPGTFTNNTVYFVPITMYSLTNSPPIYSYTNTTMPCYEMGNVYSVQYVPEITQTSVQNCVAGTVTTTVSGGQPAINGSSFTGTNLLPATASFSPGTALNGGNIVVTGLVDGDVYSYDIVDASGCSITVTGTFVGLQDPSFSYPQSAYCKDAANPSPIITGDPGGTFTSTAGLVINASTGLINLAASTAGTYTVTYQTPSATCFATATFVITINPLPIVDGNDVTICAGASVTLNGTGANTYTWNNGVVNGVPFTPASTTTYTVTGTITATGCVNTGTAVVTVVPLDNPSFTTTNYCQGSASPAATVTGLAGGTFSFNPAPGGGVTINPTTGSITGGVGGTTYTVQYTTGGACPQTSTQPVTVYALPPVNAADVSVCAGGTVAITATGAVTYSWNNGLGAGQTQNVSPAVNTNYTVTGTDANGCVNTDVMTVSVVAGAPINAGPDVTICNGASTTLMATGGVSYTWSAPISATGASQTVSPASTTTYTVNGTDASGCTGTDQVVVTVNPIPTVTAVADQVLCANTNTTAVTFTGSVVGTTYNWTNTNTSIGLGASGSGNIASFSGVNAGSTPQVATITVTPSANGCVGTPDVFTITVNPIPTVTATADQVLCANTTTTAVNFTGSVTPTTYNWTNTNTSIGLGASGAGNIGSFSATNAGSTAQVATITVTPSANGCVGTPDVFTITVNPIPTVTPVADQVLCANTNTTAVNFTGSVTPTTYNWTNTNTSIGLGASGSGNIGAFSATNAGSTAQVATITVTPSANGCVGTPDVFTITVNPIPTVTAVADQVLCANTTTTAISFTGSTAAAAYNWTNSNASIGLPVTGSGNIGSFTVSNAGSTVQVATITVTPSANGCVGTPDVFTITVNPIPTVTATLDQVLCANANTTAVNFTGSVTPTTYNWTNTNTSIGLGASGSGNIASFSGVNAGSTAQVATITVTPSANGCVGTPDVFTITINPVPTVNTVANQVLCATSNTTAVAFSGSTAGTVYTWTNTNTSIGLGASGTGNIGAFSAVNAGSTPQTATITVTPTANGCPGLTTSFTITVNPLPTAVISGTAAVCEGAASPTITFTGSNGVAPYTFTYNINGGASQTITSVGNTATITVASTPVGTYNYNLLSVMDASSTACVQAQVGTATITVNPNPTPIINGATEYCTGTTSTLSTTIAYASYAWSTGASTPSVSVTDADNPITVTVTNAQGCSATSAVFTVVENSVITYNTTVEICQGQTATIHGNVESAAGMYSQTFVLPTGCDSTSNVTLVVHALPVINAGADQTACFGTPITLNATGAPTIVWDNGVSNGVPFNQAVGTVNYTATGTDGFGCVNSDVVAVTINPIPSVNPTANQTLCNGVNTTAVTFSGSVVGTTYAWTNSNTSIGLGASGSGNIASFVASNAGSTTQTATITITPSANGCTGPTGQFTITVNPTPSVNPVVNQTLCNTSSTTAVNFGSPVVGTTYTWTNSNATIGLAASGSGNIASFVATNAGSMAQTATITITPSANGCTGPTGQFTITVNPTPTVNPVANETLCAGSNTAAVNFTSAVAGTTYSWSNNNASIGMGVNGTGNIASFVASNAGSTVQTATITITPSANGCTGPTGQYTITVNPTPSVDPIANETLCNGVNTTAVNFTGSVASTTYNWTNSNATIGLAASGSGNIGAFSATNAGSTAQVATITVTPTANGCVGASQTYTITVNPTPSVAVVANEVLCNTATTTAVNFSSPVAGTTFSWTNSNTTIGLGASGTGNIGSFSATNSTSSPTVGTIIVTPSANGCTGPTGQYTITVNPTPSVDPTANQTLCNGSNTTAVNFTGSSATITYNWTNTNTSIGLGAAGSSNIGSFVATNAGSTAQVASITVSPTENGCIGSSQIFTITVNPTPTVDPLVDQELCASSNTAAINFTGATAGTSYDWTNTNPGIGLAGSGTGNIASFVATNASSNPISGTITVTPSANGCVGSTQSAFITVNPLPTGIISGTTAVCLGAADPTITFTGSNGTAPYTFTYNVNNTGNQTITSVGNTATISVPTLVAGVFNFNLVSVQDASATGCVQAQAGVATITVNALPSVFAGNDFTICESDQAVLTASGATTYVWDQGVVNGVVFTPVSTGTYTVTGTDANGCVNTDDVTITLEAAPLVSFFGDNLSGCAPLTVTFTNTTPGNLTNCVWTLENGTTLNGCGSVTTTFNTPGTFDVTLTTTSATGCSASVTYTDYVYVEADPIASFSASSTMISNLDPVVYFDNTSTGAVNYDWNFGDGSQTTNEVSPTYSFPEEEPGTYQVELIAYSPLGCTDTAYATISLSEELIFYVPNTFTPDFDDYNPTFQPVFSSGYDPYDFTLLIFNRWGEIVFESHNADIGWDGTYGGELTQDGTYTWKIEFKVTQNDERKVVVGHVNILR